MPKDKERLRFIKCVALLQIYDVRNRLFSIAFLSFMLTVIACSLGNKESYFGTLPSFHRLGILHSNIRHSYNYERTVIFSNFIFVGIIFSVIILFLVFLQYKFI